MSKITRAENPRSNWQFVVGILVADLGLALLGLGAWDALNSAMRILIYAAGIISLLSGFSLIWLDTIRLSSAKTQPAMAASGVYLGSFRLNNCSFEAYERASHNGTCEFRLVSYPSIDPGKEAAVVRYMVNEGLIENMWPRMSRQIEEDANWAFTE